MKDFNETKEIASKLVGIYAACVVGGLFPGVAAFVARPENMSIGEAVFGGVFFTLMTPISIVVGATGILGNTVYGIFAMPRAIIKDLVQKDKQTTEITPVLSSTKIIEEGLSKKPSDDRASSQRPLHTPDNSTSLQNVAIRYESKPNLFLYTKHTREYLKSLEEKETIKEKIEKLLTSLQEAGDALTQKELAALEQFEDAITANYVEYPVFLREHLYNIKTLTTLSRMEDPFTRAPFKFSEVQSARILLEKFDEVLEDITLNHTVLRENTTLRTASI